MQNILPEFSITFSALSPLGGLRLVGLTRPSVGITVGVWVELRRGVAERDPQRNLDRGLASAVPRTWGHL